MNDQIPVGLIYMDMAIRSLYNTPRKKKEHRRSREVELGLFKMEPRNKITSMYRTVGFRGGTEPAPAPFGRRTDAVTVRDVG